MYENTENSVHLKSKFCRTDSAYIGLLILVIVILVIWGGLVRYRDGEIDYYNSDAAWHTLLTIECYNETPISEHLFLPIVSLGGEDNKYIRWGAAIPDNRGNYYYTSFSPAGFFLPWLFMKVTNLPVEERSLYIFNNILLALSAIILLFLLNKVYEKNRNRKVLLLLGVTSYLFLPELLHGQGITYWHQSVMQVTLLWQIYEFYMYAVLGKDKHKWLFYVLAFINPYIEWTGYVANIGFAIAEIITNWKKSKGRALIKGMIPVIITAGSFVVFCLHYLTRVDSTLFFEALRSRFMARNITSNILFTDLVSGYFRSFSYLWVVLLILIIWVFIKNGNLSLENGILFFVASFPILENIIMKQHAYVYTYDRMKAGFVLILLLCEIARNLFESSCRWERILVVGVVVCASLLNLHSYTKNERYIWNVDYRHTNEQIADYVTDKWPDAVYASSVGIRGYMNLLFHRGIYEGYRIEDAVNVAREKGRQTIVYIERGEVDYKVENAYIYDIETAKEIVVNVSEGQVIEKEVEKRLEIVNI